MSKTYVIAEIGINHNGDINLAKQLIDKAKQSDCNAVKFQKRDIDVVYSQEELGHTKKVTIWNNNKRTKKWY